MASNWQPDGWKAHEARHLPVYEDANELTGVESTLAQFPPLVFAGEARALKAFLPPTRGTSAIDRESSGTI